MNTPNLEGTLPQWILDLSTTKIIQANQAALDLWQYSQEELFQTTLWDRLDPEEHERGRLYIQHEAAGTAEDWIVRRKDGSSFVITTSWTQFSVDDLPYLHLIVLNTRSYEK